MSSNTPTPTPTPTPADDRLKLYFEYTTTTPALDAFDVKAVHPDELLGRPAVFTVIGESHYVGLPALGFHELCSCRPLSAEPTHETPLSTDVDREFRFRFDGGRRGATTVVVGRPLDAFPGADGATVAYRFEPRAWTTIDVTETGYETYHTYPEHDLALHTETRLTAHASPVSRSDAPAGDSIDAHGEHSP